MIRNREKLAVDRTQADYRYLVEGLEQEILKARKAMAQSVAREKKRLFFAVGRKIYDFRQANWAGGQHRDLHRALAQDFKELFTWMDTPADRAFKHMEELYRIASGIEFEPDLQLPLEICKMMASGFLKVEVSNTDGLEN